MATETKKTAPARKGNAATEMIIGSAVSDLKKVIAAADAATSKMQDLADEAEKQQGIIAQREDQIKELDVTFAETKRQKEVQMALALKENERKTVDEILAKQDLTAVDKKDYAKFQSDLATIKTEAEAEASKAAFAATGSLKKQHENDLALSKANFEKDQAITTAQLANAKSQIEFLEGQVKLWKESVDAERAAGVERSKAGSIGTINLQGASKN